MVVFELEAIEGPGFEPDEVVVEVADSSDGDDSFGDVAEAEPDKAVDPIVDIQPDKPIARQSPYDDIHKAHGLKEVCSLLYKLLPNGDVADKPIGLTQIIHGSTMSVKAICLHADHQDPSSSSSSRAPAPSKRKPCFLLMGSMSHFWPKYEACIEWLCNQDCSSEEHQRCAQQTKKHWLAVG